MIEGALTLSPDTNLDHADIVLLRARTPME
jgi:hypothetical protein